MKVKNVVLNVEKNVKVFTKVESDIIIKKNYNPLKESEGLCMEEIKRELNLKERIVIKVFSKTFNKVSNLVRINTLNNIIK